MLKAADLDIEDMQFEINSKEVQKDGSIPDDIPESIKGGFDSVYANAVRNVK